MQKPSTHFEKQDFQKGPKVPAWEQVGCSPPDRAPFGSSPGVWELPFLFSSPRDCALLQICPNGPQEMKNARWPRHPEEPVKHERGVGLRGAACEWRPSQVDPQGRMSFPNAPCLTERLLLSDFLAYVYFFPRICLFPMVMLILFNSHLITTLIRAVHVGAPSTQPTTREKLYPFSRFL